MRTRAGSRHVFKRCGCRTGGGSCPRLRRPNGTWSAGHGAWHYRLELPPDAGGRRQQLRRGGYRTHHDALAARDHAQALLRLAGDDPVAVAEVAGLLQATRHRRQLPAVDGVRRRLDAHRALDGSTTLAVYLQRWLAVRPMDENTRRTYASHIRAHVVPYLGHLTLDRLRLEHIRTMFAAIEAANEEIRAARRSADPTTRDSVRGRSPARPPASGSGPCSGWRSTTRSPTVSSAPTLQGW